MCVCLCVSACMRGCLCAVCLCRWPLCVVLVCLSCLSLYVSLCMKRETMYEDEAAAGKKGSSTNAEAAGYPRSDGMYVEASKLAASSCVSSSQYHTSVRSMIYAAPKIVLGRTCAVPQTFTEIPTPKSQNLRRIFCATVQTVKQQSSPHGPRAKDKIIIGFFLKILIHVPEMHTPTGMSCKLEEYNDGTLSHRRLVEFSFTPEANNPLFLFPWRPRKSQVLLQFCKISSTVPIDTDEQGHISIIVASATTPSSSGMVLHLGTFLGTRICLIPFDAFVSKSSANHVCSLEKKCSTKAFSVLVAPCHWTPLPQ